MDLKLNLRHGVPQNTPVNESFILREGEGQFAGSAALNLPQNKPLALWIVNKD